MYTLQRLWKRLPWWMEFGILVGIAVGFFLFGAGIVWAALAPIPAINSFENRKIAESTKIYDRTGNIVLFDVYGQIRRTVVPLEEISPYIQKATIAVEDAEFYEHNGFRPKAFMRAAWINFTTGSFSQGGSTITQQVIKNALLTQRKTIARKIEEIILALRLERMYSKEQILETYLNETSYGGTVYGVQEASQYFFGIDASEVDLAEAAYLAALPQAPTRYSPYGNNRDLLEARQKFVLERMRTENLIDEEEYAQALEEVVAFRSEATAGIKAPHFVFFIREYLEEKYGADTVAQGGLSVITTLDWELQEKAEEVVAKHAPGMEANFNASNEGIIAIDPSTGQILAMVGSRDYFEVEIDGAVNVTTSHQQPGSVFKPFVYAAALERGYTPETVVFDVPTQFSSLCSPQETTNSTPPCYAPTSFDDTFKGPVTFREALAQSLNVPAVKTLYLVGIANALKMAERAGITTLTNPDAYGLSLVLGGGDVTLLELTSAYAVFANDGVRNPPASILRVEDSRGNVLEEYEEVETRSMDTQIARQINDILSDNVARTPEFGSNSPLYFPGHHVAAKTGTTDDYWDVWILGYTPGIAVGAWAGNNDNTPMEKRIAAFIISPMWHEIMEYAIDKYPSESFVPPAPEGTDTLPPVLQGSWNADPGSGVHSILHSILKDDPRGGEGGNPSDPQYLNWEYGVASWALRELFASSTVALPPGLSPDLFSELLPGSPQPGELQIIAPSLGAILPAGNPTVFTARHARPETVLRVTYYLNGAHIGESSVFPYSISFTPHARGVMQLRAVADTTAGQDEQFTTFSVQ